MSVVRTWRRAALGASGVGLLVPVALLAALAVTASVGGSGSLGGLSQLFAGPTVPRALQGGLPGDVREGRTGGDVPAVPHASPPTPAGLEAAPRSTAERERARTPRRAPVERRGRTAPVTTRPEAPETPPAAAPTAPEPAPEPEPEPEPPTRPTDPVRRIGSALADTVRQLPVVGAPVGDAVQTVVDLVAPPRARSEPPPPPPPAPAPAPAPTPSAPAVPVPAPPAAP